MTIKVAISLPEELLEAVEQERQVLGQTRSEFFRQVAEAYLRRQRMREAVERYQAGYREQPETEEEVAAAHRAGAAILAQEPWE